MPLSNLIEKADKYLDRLTQRTERETIKAYKASLKEIRSQISLAYEKYAQDGILTRSEMMKYNRLATLERNIVDEVNKLARKTIRISNKAFEKTLEESYYYTAFALERTAQAKLGFGIINPKVIEESVNNPLDAIGWKNRTRDNIAVMTKQIRQEITAGLIQGKEYNKVAKSVTERTNVGASKAIRIVQTETHRIQQVGRLRSMEQARSKGVIMKKVWTATLDSRTRDTHQALDGQRVYMDDYFSIRGLEAEGPGLFGVAEEDVRCRCSVRPEIEGYEPTLRRARGEGIIPYTTYSDWKENRL